MDKNLLQKYWEKLILVPLHLRTGKLTLVRRSNLGDELLMTAVARGVKSTNPKHHIKVVCSHPELFLQNPNIDEVVTKQDLNDHALGFHLNYEREFEANKESSRHLIEIFLDQVGISTTAQGLIPEIYLTDAEKQWGHALAAQNGPYITISTQTSRWTPNKMWNDSSWQEVIDFVSRKVKVIQIGLDNEPQFKNTTRMSGKLSLRETFSVQAFAQLHLGVVSFPMHSAAAVGTKSVIVYGGYEKPSTSAYPNVIALSSDVECSPCWLRTPCPFDLKCMKQISSTEVIEAVGKALGSFR